MKLLILRPRPGAEETAERARSLGLEPQLAPLFELRPLEWRPPDPSMFEAVMLTSANGARLAGPKLASFRHLPCYAVGEASAAAAEEAGFTVVRTGPADGASLLEMMASDGVTCAFHPRGRDNVPLRRPGIELDGRGVYASEAVRALPREATEALAEGAVALIHSPRAGALLASLAPDRGRTILAAISRAAADASGHGWRRVAVAERPRDEALLELAAKLCNSGGGDGTSD